MISDVNDDGEYENVGWWDSSSGLVSQHSWALDHLAPGERYWVTVVATDANGDSSHAYGEFTTLSNRSVDVELGEIDITGGPDNIKYHTVLTSVNGSPLVLIDEGITGLFYDSDSDRYIDLALQVVQTWETSNSTICEVSPTTLDWPAGNSDDSCSTWNTAFFHDLDIDVVPWNHATWTSVTFEQTIVAASGGEPRDFGLSAPLEFVVTYS